jgi:hypothetical protein
MSSLDIPFAADDTAAPLCKEWPEYPWEGMPAQRRYSLTLSMKYVLEKGLSV